MMSVEPNPAWALHDFRAHKIDRTIPHSWPTCDRCIQICVISHDEKGMGHLVPPSLRRRLEEIAVALAEAGAS
jgi:hypothetical protein